MLLATVGAGAGLGVAVFGTAVLAEHLPGNLRILQPYVAITANPVVIGFTAIVAVVCTIVFGVSG